MAVVGGIVPATVRENDIMYHRTSQGEPMGGTSIEPTLNKAALPVMERLAAAYHVRAVYRPKRYGRG